MRALGLGLTVASFGITAPALADDRNSPVVLEPSTYWSVDFGEEKCRLARAFGEGDNRHLLYLEQGGPSASFGFVVVGPSFDRFKKTTHISTQFGDFDPIQDRAPFLGTTETLGASIIYSSLQFKNPPDEGEIETGGDLDLPRMDTELAGKINSITIRYRKLAVVFETGSLEDAIKVLNECALNFVEEWGLDRSQHETMTKTPVWLNPESVAKRIQRQYPSSALRKGEQGIFRMRVLVEADGNVSDCVVNNATITESLETPACKEMQRANFEPALDKAGKPMRSFYTTQIVYRIN